MPFVEVFEFKGDKLHRGRTYFDAATMMRLLGKQP
jgi:limonene-1,2-epoxide hydrolase